MARRRWPARTTSRRGCATWRRRSKLPHADEATAESAVAEPDAHFGGGAGAGEAGAEAAGGVFGLGPTGEDLRILYAVLSHGPPLGEGLDGYHLDHLGFSKAFPPNAAGRNDQGW